MSHNNSAANVLRALPLKRGRGHFIFSVDWSCCRMSSDGRGRFSSKQFGLDCPCNPHGDFSEAGGTELKSRLENVELDLAVMNTPVCLRDASLSIN